jgi:PAS domain S-box-containing protein
MPQEERSSAKTARIDLRDFDRMPAAEAQAQPPLPRLPSSHWSRPTRLMDSVVRSRYQDLLQSIYDAALITDLSGQIVDTNQRAVEFFQHEQADLCRMAAYEIIAGADETLMESLNENLRNDRFTVIEAFCRRRDGSTFPAEIAVNKLRLDKLRLCFLVRDTTQRTQAEVLLRREHSAIHNSGNGIVIADLELKLEYANPAFARMLGYGQPEALLSRDLRDFLTDPQAGDGVIRHVTREAAPWMSELKMRKQDGSEIDVQVSAACSRDADGAPDGVVFSFADVTAHRQAEEALRLAQMALEQAAADRSQELTNVNRQLLAEIDQCRGENERLRQTVAELRKALERPQGQDRKAG